MTEKFSKYSKTQNIASSNILINDNDSPYTFKAWIERNTSILPGRERLQYENYVKDWYRNKKQEIPTSESVKEDYINLIKQLTIAFKSESDAIWASDINFDDPNEIAQVIPFYATKLKEIAIYLINKREAVRRAKLKYNMTGTYAALERVFYEYLLKSFTKRRFPGDEYVTSITDVNILTSIPELSAVQSSFQIFVEELYDDASYFDRDPNVSPSAYFTINDSATSFLDSLNISPSDIEWLYTTGTAVLCAENPLLWSLDNALAQYQEGVPLSAVELYDSDILNDYNRIKLSKKYIGENQYILSGGYYLPWVETVNFNFANGNNWFYWLTGENLFEGQTVNDIEPIELNKSKLLENGATSDTFITGADVIFAVRNESISGAWLRSVNEITVSDTMSARLDKGKTIFAFPFPGYGLSGEDLEWTGKSLNNLDRTFLYLTDEQKQAVFNAYWDTSTPSVTSFDSLYIYDTTLIESGAKSAHQFDEADFIAIRPKISDAVKDAVYNGPLDYAWLYKMEKTDIPIKKGDNNIYWPFERYETNISMVASSTQCAPIELTNIDITNFIGAIASNKLDKADKIFKKSSPNSNEYIEGAWLKGEKLPQPVAVTNASLVSGSYQPSLALRVLGGAYASFIWTVSSNEYADSVFKHANHQHDCLYLESKQFSLLKERPTQQKDINYNQWQNCSCRAIVYSPLGHPGNNFDDYDQMADFIVAIKNPISGFDFKNWRGFDNNDYTTSTEFGWYKLTGNQVEPDVGWGRGNWFNYTGTQSFILSSGVMYLYYRNNMHRDAPNSNVPYYIVKHKIPTYNKVKWMKLYFDRTNNEWIDTNLPTDMIIKPGDFLTYKHKDSFSIVLTSSHEKCVEENVIYNPGSPLIQFNPNSVTTNTNGSFISVSGSGSMSISGTFDNGNNQTLVTTTSTVTSTVTDYYTYLNPSMNFVLNVPLLGWNYTNNSYDVNAYGAKPFWAVASDEDDDYTKLKGIDIWSGSPVLVDEYNFITQPPFSKLYFNNNTYIEYNKRDIGFIVWKQPVKGIASINDTKWCDIIINTDGISNLSAFLYNNIDELIISATNKQSNLSLYTVQDEPLQINYYARNKFTWSQEISHYSLGYPPTGGLWVPIVSGELLTADAPYTNLSNRHFPTYATVPSIGDLYSTRDSGGYFIPKLLGVSTAVSKNILNKLDTSKINNDISKRGKTTIYRDLNTFYSDRGLSHADQFSPVSNIATDATWMKASVTEGLKAGIITESRDHQEFMPYETKYEILKNNNNGLYRQGADVYDPWYGDEDIEWENPVDWPANFRKQYDIKGWYDQQDKGSLQVYQWKTDIFGNQYALLKGNKFNELSIYDKKHKVPGVIWTRSTRNILQPASKSLIEVFKDIQPPELSATGGYEVSTITNGVTTYTTYLTSGVLDIDLWFDTLMLYTSTGLYFYNLKFDYDTNTIYSIADSVNYIITQNSIYGGTWFHEQDKKVTVCTLLSCGSQIRPILRSLNLETNTLDIIFDKESIYTDISTSGHFYTILDHPVFTYDYKTKTYNISYASYTENSILSGMFLNSINIKDYGNYHDIVDSKIIIPKS